MKNKGKYILILFPLVLTSCGMPKEAIFATKNLDSNYMIEIEEEEIINMLSNGMSFSLYMYSNNCEMCNQTKQFLTTFHNEYGQTIYGYNPSVNYGKLMDYNENIFSNYVLTPTIKVFENGLQNLEIAKSKYSSYNMLSNSLKTFLVPSNGYTTTTLEGYNAFFNSTDEYIVYFYDNNDKNSMTNYSNFIQPHYEDNIKILAIDLDLINSNLEHELKEKYQGLDTLSNYIIYKDNKGNITQNYEIEATIAAIYSSN